MKSLSLLSILLLEAIAANIVSTKEECNRDNIGAVRLTCPRNSNNEGAVQMCAEFKPVDNPNSDVFNINWIYLGTDGWDEAAATVVCKQLGIPYTGVEAFMRKLPSNILAINEAINCNGEEGNLRDCFGPTISVSFTLSRDLPSVVCKCNDGAVRLVDGANYREGRVEVCVDGRWGTVCGEDWGNGQASEVCEELRFSGEGATLMRFGNGTGQIHTLTCSSSDNCTTTPAQNCHHGMDVGVRCLAQQDVVCATENTNCSQMDVKRPTVSDNITTTGLGAITGLLSAALLAVVVGWIGSCVYLKRQMALVAIANRARVVPTTTSNEAYGITDGMMDAGTTANEAYGVTAGNEDADLTANGAYEITDIIARQSQSVELLDTKCHPYYSVIPE